VGLLIRTWNLFHGNAKPPERQAFLEQMVRLISTGDPDVACLQELPAWALPHLEEWSGMTAVGAVAQPARFGPLPIGADLGRAITSLNHGLFRSAVAGQANAILLAAGARVLRQDALTLNAPTFRRAQSEWLGLGLIARLAWAKERRVVQAVRARLRDGTAVLVGNLHATSYPADQRLADAELLRAAVFVDAAAEPDDVCILAGDFNVSASRSATLAELADGDWGFSGAAQTGIDHVLVRGASVSGVERWPSERRRIEGRLLSDHTPVEVRAA
jgi:endonuclease/exonuclease/phosphatase family metal-dependent hydrolase